MLELSAVLSYLKIDREKSSPDCNSMYIFFFPKFKAHAVHSYQEDFPLKMYFWCNEWSEFTLVKSCACTYLIKFASD